MRLLKIIAICALFLLMAMPVLAVSLSGYPTFFGSNLPVVVVGQHSSSSDVSAAILIIKAIYNVQDSQGFAPLPAGSAGVDVDIADVSQRNTILIGSACINQLTSKILGNPSPCDSAVPSGKGLVKLFVHPQGTITLVLAAQGDKIIDLVKIVQAWNHPNLASYEVVSENEVLVPLAPTTSQTPVPPPVPVPQPPAPTPSSQPVYTQNSVSDTLRPGESQTYTLNKEEFTVELKSLQDVSLIGVVDVNGENINVNPQTIGTDYTLADGSTMFRVIQLTGTNTAKGLVMDFTLISAVSIPIPAIPQTTTTATKVVAQRAQKESGITKSTLPSRPVSPPVQLPPRPACNGCETNKGCLSFGAVFIGEQGVMSFCDTDKTIKPKKADGMACQNNFDCTSDSCTSNVCGNLAEHFQKTGQELQVQKNLMQRITDFFSRLFRFG